MDNVEVVSNYNNIDPNEIENISILKDASATAVYGVRGANGVLLITTKRGKTGKPQMSYTANLALTQFTALRKNMDSYNYVRGWNEALRNDSYITRRNLAKRILKNTERAVTPFFTPIQIGLIWF